MIANMNKLLSSPYSHLKAVPIKSGRLFLFRTLRQYYDSYKIGFNGVVTTSPMTAPGHQVSQSAC